MTTADIHNLCDERGISWNSDKGFLDRCELVTGERNLDDMSEEQLVEVEDDINATFDSLSVAKTAAAEEALLGRLREALSSRSVLTELSKLAAEDVLGHQVGSAQAELWADLQLQKEAGWWDAEGTDDDESVGGTIHLQGGDAMGGKVVIGDEPADILGDALTEVREAYNRELKRDPTEVEMQKLWEFVDKDRSVVKDGPMPTGDRPADDRSPPRMPAWFGQLRPVVKTAAQGVYYHGSPKKLTELRAGSYVTPHKADAASFGVKWSTDELKEGARGGDGGRPPLELEFKGEPLPDHPVYVYEVRGKVRPEPTNTGRVYSWNRAVIEETPVKLVRTIKSWHAELLKKPKEGHAKKRARQRGASAGDVEALEARLNGLSLSPGQTYHYRLRGGNYAVVAPTRKGKKHVVKTVLGLGMSPPGLLLPLAEEKPWKPAKSSNIEATRYDPDAKKLEVKFKGGGHYSYEDVPAVKARGIHRAKSPGRYFHRQIRGNYEHKKVAEVVEAFRCKVSLSQGIWKGAMFVSSEASEITWDAFTEELEKLGGFKSEAQRRFMFAAERRGDVSKKVLDDFVRKTPKGADLPDRVKEASKLDNTLKLLRKVTRAEKIAPAAAAVAKPTPALDKLRSMHSGVASPAPQIAKANELIGAQWTPYMPRGWKPVSQRTVPGKEPAWLSKLKPPEIKSTVTTQPGIRAITAKDILNKTSAAGFYDELMKLGAPVATRAPSLLSQMFSGLFRGNGLRPSAVSPASRKSGQAFPDLRPPSQFPPRTVEELARFDRKKADIGPGILGQFMMKTQAAKTVTVGPPPKRNRKEYPYTGTIQFQDLPLILVENKKGSTRSGTARDGTTWSTTMVAHYGEFKGTMGKDGDPVDVYVGPDGSSQVVYIAHTKAPPTFKRYDEDKVFVGYSSMADVRKAFGKSYDKAGFWGGASACSVEDLKRVLKRRAARGKKLGQEMVMEKAAREAFTSGFEDEVRKMANVHLPPAGQSPLMPNANTPSAAMPAPVSNMGLPGGGKPSMPMPKPGTKAPVGGAAMPTAGAGANISKVAFWTAFHDELDIYVGIDKEARLGKLLAGGAGLLGAGAVAAGAAGAGGGSDAVPFKVPAAPGKPPAAPKVDLPEASPAAAAKPVAQVASDFKGIEAKQFKLPSIEDVAGKHKVSPEFLKAISYVESRGSGPSAVRFEPHRFHKATEGRFKEGVPYTRGPKSAVSRIASETDRGAFDRAFALDPESAVKSTSFGTFQTMGKSLLNLAGGSAKDAVEMFDSAPKEVSAALMGEWLDENPAFRTHVARAEKSGDWSTVARLYNGPMYHTHGYDKQLAGAFQDQMQKSSSDKTAGIIGKGLKALRGGKPRASTLEDLAQPYLDPAAKMSVPGLLDTASTLQGSPKMKQRALQLYEDFTTSPAMKEKFPSLHGISPPGDPSQLSHFERVRLAAKFLGNPKAQQEARTAAPEVLGMKGKEVISSAFHDELDKLAEPPPPNGWYEAGRTAEEWDHFLQTGEETERGELDRRRAFGQKKTAASKTLRVVVESANKDKWLEGTVLTTGGKKRKTISHQGKVVGFMTPRKEEGVIRLGPVYVRPEYRGNGYATAAIKKHVGKRGARAEIEKGNRSSVRAFTAAGFSKVETKANGTMVFEINTEAAKGEMKKKADANELAPALGAALGAGMGLSHPEAFNPSWMHPSIKPGRGIARILSPLLGAATVGGLASLPGMFRFGKKEEEKLQIDPDLLRRMRPLLKHGSDLWSGFHNELDRTTAA